MTWSGSEPLTVWHEAERLIAESDIRGLERFLGEGRSPFMRSACASELARVGDRDGANLLERMARGDPDDGVRASAIWAGGHHVDAIRFFGIGMKDARDKTRAESVFELAKLAPDLAGGELREATRDESARVRLAAAAGLRRVRDPSALDELIVLLSDSDRHVRAAASLALSDLSDPRAVPALRAAAKGRGPIQRFRMGISAALIEKRVHESSGP